VAGIIFFASLLLGEVRTMTLPEALNRAMQQNPDVALARLDEQKAQYAVDIARDPFVPKLFAGSGLAYSSGFPMSIGGSAPSVFEARAISSIFNRPQHYRVAQARENARTAGLDTQSRRDEVAYRVAVLFYDARRAALAASAAARQVDNLARVAQAVEVRVADGRELPIQGKRAALNVARARQQTEQLEGEQANLETSLAIALGFDATDRVRPTAEDPTPAPGLPDSEQAAVDSALASSREIKRLESQALAKNFEVRASKAAKLPQVDLVAQYGLFAKFNNYDEFFNRFERHNGQIGISMQLPILVGSAARAQALQAEQDIARLKIQMTEARNRIALETRQSFQTVKRAETSADVARLDLDVARDQVSVLLAQMQEGRAGTEQIEAARSVENEKWIEYYRARTALEQARLDLLRRTASVMAMAR
jgi:outer membrane protein TolC